jgi:D-alanyl-D-alanine carboxypeptidase/D-alanyl-D-alanine-endopeptidase (penicillin-binding protein 4)
MLKIIIIHAITWLIQGQTLQAATPNAQLKPALSAPTVKLLKKARIDPNQLGFAIYDIENGKALHSYNPKKPFIPASVNKMLSCYMSLLVLGPQYRFTTEFWLQPISEKQFELIILGGADPSLDGKALMKAAINVQQATLGKEIVKFSYIDNLFPKSDMISDLGLDDQAYNPGLGPLSASYNRFVVYSPRGKPQSTIPPLTSIQLRKSHEKFSPGKKFNHIASSEIETWLYSRKVRYRRFENVPIRKPGLFTSELFRFLAKKNGLDLPAPKEKASLSQKAKKIFVLKSDPLERLVDATLEYSNNLYAESMYLYALRTINRIPISLEDSGKYFLKWLEKHFDQIDWKGSRFANGSGLSTLNRVTPSQFSQALIKAHDFKLGDNPYWNLLSISAESGFLRRKMRTPPLAFNIWAKTGSLDYVNNLAGYFYSQSGQKLAFTLFINDFEKRRLSNGPNGPKVNRLRRRARTWKRRTNQLIEDLLSQWIQRF